jgi:tetratricopeptide (TPR) repeat protein
MDNKSKIRGEHMGSPLPFLFFFLFLQLSPAISNIADTTWWQPIYNQGIELVKTGQFEEAKKEFNKILTKDKKVAYAFYGLGLSYNEQEFGSEKAVKNLRKAINLDPDLAEAHYHLGLIYEYRAAEYYHYRSDAKIRLRTAVEKNPHLIDAWIALARVEEKFTLIPPPSAIAVNILANALKFNPKENKLYTLFINTVLWNSREKEGISILKDLQQINSSNWEYSYDSAKMYYKLQKYFTCLSVLDSIEIFYANYSKGKVKLLKAKCFFNINEEDKGLDFYLQALKSVNDTSDAHEFYSDIQYIMNNSEFDELQSASPGDLAEFYNRFWLSRDPNLATEKNERIVEHYKRMVYARKNYRRYVTGQYVNVALYKLDRPRASKKSYAVPVAVGLPIVKMGDEFLNPIVSKALPENRDIDDMGLIYLRHGTADNFATYTGNATPTVIDSTPQNFSWQYLANKKRSEMIFHFVKHSEARGWMIESFPSDFRNRWVFGGIYTQLDPTLNPTIIQEPLPGVGDLFADVVETTLHHAKTGTQTETSEYSYAKKMIQFPIEILSFKEWNNRIKVHLFYGIDGQNIKIESTQQGNSLNYSKFVAFFNEQWESIIHNPENKIVPLDLTAEQWKDNSIVALEKYSLFPGTYNVEIQLQDNLSDNLGVYKGSYSLEDYWQGDLILSDIILSGEIKKENKITRFRMGEVVYNPHMFSAYEIGATLGLYFEVYNLTFDAYGQTDYQLTWTLREKQKEGFFNKLFSKEKTEIKATIEYTGKTQDDKIFLNLDLTDRNAGQYELLLELKDLNSQQEASKKVNFTIRDN